MSFSLRYALLSLALLPLASCASAPDPQAQSLVESIALNNSDVVRLTVHAVPAGATVYKAVASTSSRKLGKPSDPEDLKALQTGDVQVLTEKDAIDVTVPILMKNGKPSATAGVTVKESLGRDAAVALARKIAGEVEQGMMNASMKKK